MALVPVAKGENLPFESACQAFEELCKPTNDRHHRENVVRRLWSNFGIEEHASFPLMRLMLPHLDTSSRPNYKLKQKGLAALYVDMMGLDPNSTAAQTMTNWKRPSTGFQKSEQGNFPEVMYEVIKPRCKPRADLPRRVTIGEVNALLDRLAREQEKLPPMREIHTRCTALEQKWIFRIITKDLGIGMKEDKVFKLLHPDAQELYNSVCDLSATCEKCADPEYRLESISLELFKPVRRAHPAAPRPRRATRDAHRLPPRKPTRAHAPPAGSSAAGGARQLAVRRQGNEQEGRVRRRVQARRRADDHAPRAERAVRRRGKRPLRAGALVL